MVKGVRNNESERHYRYVSRPHQKIRYLQTSHKDTGGEVRYHVVFVVEEDK